MFGSAFLAVPGIGPVVIGGPLVAILIGALENAVVVDGLSALGAALYSIGIPKDSILQYETAIKVGKFVVIVHGTAKEVAQAKEILKNTRAVETSVHSN